MDVTIRATYGYAKQSAGFGYCGVKGLNALVATLSTPLSRPVICATRLRAGKANSARGAPRLVADALKATKACGAGGPVGQGLIVLRADSAFYTHNVIATARRAKVRFSITARMNPAVRQAIRSPTTPGRRSPTQTRSVTTTSNGWSPTRRSPRPPSPRSPAAARASRSPAGCSYAA